MEGREFHTCNCFVFIRSQIAREKIDGWGGGPHPPEAVEGIGVIWQGHDLVGLRVVMVGVLVNVVHIQLGHLSDDLLQRCPLIVDQGVDQAVARRGAGRVLVGEVDQPGVGDGRYFVG